MSTARLQVDGLRIQTDPDDDVVVSEVAFALAPGQTLGLVGESGSGKTTVALALLAHARPGLRIVAGRVRVDGEDVLGLPDRAVRRVRGRRVAYVPQDPGAALNPSIKVGAQLDEMLAKGTDGADPGQRRSEVLEEVGLGVAGVADAYPHQLSGGQQQRVALAMAFALRPGVIVLDEPTTGLDVSTQRRVIDTIRDLCGTHGVAALFVSHDLAVVSELVDHLAVMYAGRIVEQGRCESLFDAPGHPYTRALLRAMPVADRTLPLHGLAGQPPRLGQRPRGCSFQSRCELVVDQCRAAIPPPVPVDAADHLARCVRAGETAATSPAPASLQAAAPADGTVLTVDALSAAYGRTTVVHDVALTLAGRECLAIVGESGSGKTTVARCIVGLHTHWSGRISWREEALRPGARHRTRESLQAIQYVFQNPYSSLNPRRRVSEILRQPLERFGVPGRGERQARVLRALADAALDESFLGRYPAELSGGERQRVAIAKALVGEPQVLVCDEITSALDVSVQAAIVEMLRRLQRERSLALVFITHNLALVRSFAQRIAVMQGGRIVETGVCDQLLDHPQHEYTTGLLRDLPRPRAVAS